MPDADLLAWADAQPRTGAFGINPAVTTEGVPAVGWYHGFLEVKQSGRRITLTESSGQYRTWTNCTSSNQWTGWKPQALATPPQIFNLPLVDGFSNFDSITSAYWKNQFGEVTVILQARKEQPLSDIEIAAYLPAGFRPSAPQRFLCLGPTLRKPGFLYVTPDGNIIISFGGDASCTDVLASFTFLAAD